MYSKVVILSHYDCRHHHCYPNSIVHPMEVFQTPFDLLHSPNQCHKFPHAAAHNDQHHIGSFFHGSESQSHGWMLDLLACITMCSNWLWLCIMQLGVYQNKYARMDVYVNKYVRAGRPKLHTKVLRTKTSEPATLMWRERYLGNFLLSRTLVQRALN